MMRPPGAGRKGSIFPSEATKEFLELCSKVHHFLQNQIYREQMGQPVAASLEKMPGGEYFTRKFLPVGLIFVATPSRKDPKITSLRIFFDPLRFKTWKEGLGPVKLVFLDPYNIEVSRNDKKGTWHTMLDGKALNMDLGREDPYEMAAIEIHNCLTEGDIDAVRIR